MATGISTRQATRAVARDMLRAQRERKLPLSWLGTGGHADPADDGWQDRMWWHPLFAAGGTYLAGTLVDHALTAGVVASYAVGPIEVAPGGVAGLTSVGVGMVAGLAGFLATAGYRFSDWARAYMAAGPVAAGAWLAGVAATSPYNLPMFALAAAGTGAAMLGYRRMREEQDLHEQRFVARFASPAPPPGPGAPPSPRPAPPVEVVDPEARRWNAAFDAVGLKGCRYRKRVDTPAGFAVLVVFPASGTIGMREVDAKLDALERNLRMLKDCLEVDVAIDPATGRELADRCWVHVDVADILSQTLTMPDEHEPTTINKAFRIGTFMDGRPMTLRLREISALIVGVRGRGKTNLFHVIVHQLSRCIDVVLWAIDLKGGRAVKPWLSAWLTDKAARPIFDWVATTRLEAALMLHAAKALIGYRGNASVGGSKIEPSEGHPAVLVLCDEVAALVGKHSGPTRSTDWADPTPTQMANVLTLIIQLGRSEAVDVVLFSQRATVTMVGGGDLKSQCEMRIGLGVTNQGDASSVFQSDRVNAKKLAKLKNKRTRGACLIENGDDPNHLCGKCYFYGDGQALLDRIENTATLHAMYPADLSELEQRAIDEALRYLTAPRDKKGNIVGPGTHGYGVGPDGAADERWSMARAAHLYTDGLPDEWSDDEDDAPGGRIDATGPTGAVATAARPAARPTTTAAPAPQQRSHPQTEDGSTGAGAAGVGGNRYYVRRRDRPVGEDLKAAAADETVPVEDLDAGFAAYLDSLGETDEPQLVDDNAEELSRYDLMIDVIRKAGTTGTSPTPILAEMRERGNCWSARTDIYPALRKALADGLVVQPAGKYGRYYHRDHAPTRPA